MAVQAAAHVCYEACPLKHRMHQLQLGINQIAMHGCILESHPCLVSKSLELPVQAVCLRL